MTAARVIPYFRMRIVPRLIRGESVLISAHGNSLRAIIMHLEQLTAEQIVVYELATGVPHIYHFDSSMRLVDKRILARRKEG